MFEYLDNKQSVKYEAAKRMLTLKKVAEGIGMGYNIFIQRLNGFAKADNEFYQSIKKFFDEFDSKE